MSNTVKLNTCPKCNAPIPAEAPQGLCPKCVLLGAATATEQGVPATATSEIPSIERIAAAFPQLEILELIGRGGMGFVFKARQPHLDRFVALKLLPDKLAKDAQFAERFNREGRVLAKLNHPNITSVFDFGHASAGSSVGAPISKSARSSGAAPPADLEIGAPAAQPETRNPKLGTNEGGFYYLLMEYVDGVNLRQAMRAGRFSPAEALSIVPKVCEALQNAHEQGILHRDIKPENILLDAKGRVKIADFGIAKLVGEDQPSVTLTNTGAALGTPHYMAPEQLEKPSTVDHRADIYSLGVVFYEMLTGELPIGRFAAPSSKTPVGTSVDEVVFRTLEKDRERRFQSAGEMRTQVQDLGEGTGAAPAASSPLPPAEDFILCPPGLPRMAKALIIYALVAAPLLWLVSLFALPPLPEHALVAFTQGAVNLLVSVGEFLVLIVLAIGGWKLRGQRSSAPGWIKFALWSHLGALALALAGQLFVEVLANDVTPDAPSVAPTLGDGLLLALGLVAIAFEISALVWLRRHGTLLKSFCKSDVAPKGPRGTMDIPPSAVLPPPAWSKKSIWSAALVAVSFVGPLFLAAAVSLIFARARIGGWEMLAAALLPALAGTFLGWMALSDVSLSGGRLRGAAFAVFAALAWPVLLSGGLTIWLVVAPIRNFGESVPFASFLLMLVPAGLVTFIIWAIYTTTRKATGQPAPQRRGALKWIFLGLMLSALGLLVPVIPVASWFPANFRAGPRSGVHYRVFEVESAVADKLVPVALRHTGGTGNWQMSDISPETLSALLNERVLKHVMIDRHRVIRASKSSTTIVTSQKPGVKDAQQQVVVGWPIVSDGWGHSLANLVSNDIARVSGYGFFGVRRKDGELQLKIQHVVTHKIGDRPSVDVNIAYEGNAPQTGALAFFIPFARTDDTTGYLLLAVEVNNGAAEAELAQPAREPMTNNTPPMIQFTFTSVELREEAGARWLAMDYVEQVRGDCQETFRYDARVPGFTAQTRKDSRLSDAKAGFAPVRHQRILWKLPDSLPQGDALSLRDLVAKEWVGRSAVIEPEDERVLFKTLVPDGGTLAAAVGVRIKAEGAFIGLSVEQAVEQSEAADVRIRLAREKYEMTQRAAAAGVSSQETLAEAERELAVAEARGDAEAVARANLKFADYKLRTARKKFEAGVIAADNVRIAENERAIAELELKAALKAWKTVP